MNSPTPAQVVNNLSSTNTVRVLAVANGMMYYLNDHFNDRDIFGNRVLLSYPMRSAWGLLSAGAAMHFGANCISFVFGEKKGANFTMSALLCASSLALGVQTCIRWANSASVNEPVKAPPGSAYSASVNKPVNAPPGSAYSASVNEPVKAPSDSADSDTDSTDDMKNVE